MAAETKGLSLRQAAEERRITPLLELYGHREAAVESRRKSALPGARNPLS